MWYVQLLRRLARMACKKNPNEAEFYIIELVFLFEENLYKEPPLMLLMGFIKDVYFLAKRAQKQELSLGQFSRSCLGFIILHTKFSEDYRTDNEYFLDIIKNERILAGLQLDEELRQLSDNLLYPEFAIDDLYYLKMLGKIERETFSTLTYRVSIDLYTFGCILSTLLVSQNEPLELITDFLLSIMPHLEYSDDFDDFIELVVGIMDTEVQYQLKAIHKQLEDYVAHSKKTLSFFHFFTEKKYKHTNEVADVIKQISNEDMDDPILLLQQLDEIQMSNPNDKLIEIMSSLEHLAVQVDNYYTSCEDLGYLALNN